MGSSPFLSGSGQTRLFGRNRNRAECANRAGEARPTAPDDGMMAGECGRATICVAGNQIMGAMPHDLMIKPPASTMGEAFVACRQTVLEDETT